MSDPFTFNPMNIRCDMVYTDVALWRLPDGGPDNSREKAMKEVWYYPVPGGNRLEADWSYAGSGGGGALSAPRKCYIPDILKDGRILSLQQQHAEWVAGLSAHERLAIAAAQREGVE